MDSSVQLALTLAIATLLLLLLVGVAVLLLVLNAGRRLRHEKEAATLETQALRAQMNPHFIFNALNSINAHLQRNDTANASRFLTTFARVMRSVLENSRHAEVPLQDDLNALRGYLDLERQRLEGRFEFDVQVAPDLDPERVLVPPLVMQPFVENAIWHGIAPKEGSGHILLRVERQGDQLLWTIEDDGVGRQAKNATAATATKRTSLGTAITRSRLDLVRKQHGGEAGFTYEDLPQGTRVVVHLPYLAD